MPREIKAIIVIFFLGNIPQGFVFPPTASRKCAEIPTAKKYITQIATTLSISNEPERDPHAAKQVTMLVYGRNNIPRLILKFLDPNFGTYHSEVLSLCNVV